MDDIKKVWPKWEVVSVLGQGGFGKVYKVKRETFGEVTYGAVKVVKIPSDIREVDEMASSGLTADGIKNYYKEMVIHLLDEIKMMEKMKSASHIVSIEDYEVVENTNGFGWTIYIRMELLTNLLDYIKENSMEQADVENMGIQILKALEFCHARNIIHRDIKPGNIFISEFGEYKLGDFGISREMEKANATMSQKGTKSYMAPEMIRFGKYGKTVDLYALGLTMYELLNHGRMPFLPPYPEAFYPNDKEQAITKRLFGDPIPDAACAGEGLNRILKKACTYKPEERFQTAKEMSDAIMKLNRGMESDNKSAKENFQSEEVLKEDSRLFENQDERNFFSNEDDVGYFDDANNMGGFDDKSIDGFGDENNYYNFDTEKTYDAYGNRDNAWFFEDEKSNSSVHSNYENKSHASMEPNQNKKNTDSFFGMPVQEPDEAFKKVFGAKDNREPLNKKCSKCGKMAYMRFAGGYMCPSCATLDVDEQKVCSPKQVALYRQVMYANTPLDKQIDVYKEMSQLEPDCAQIYANLGAAYRRSGLPDMAIECYEKAIRLDDRDALAYANMGAAYIAKGQFDRSLSYLEKAIQQHDKGLISEDMKGIIFGNYCYALAELGKKKEALRIFARAKKEGYGNWKILQDRYGLYDNWESKLEQILISSNYEKFEISKTDGSIVTNPHNEVKKHFTTVPDSAKIYYYQNSGFFNSGKEGLVISSVGIHNRTKTRGAFAERCVLWDDIGMYSLRLTEKNKVLSMIYEADGKIESDKNLHVSSLKAFIEHLYYVITKMREE